MRKTLIALLASVGLLFGLGLAVAPQASAAASLSETFNCSGSTGTDGIWAGNCTGYWYAGNNFTREAYVDIWNVRYWSTGGYRDNYIHQVSSTAGRRMVYTWRCQHDDGTTSSSLGSTTVGGGLANSFTWGGQGWNPCPNEGLNISIAATYGAYVYTTVVKENAPVSLYAKKWHGDEKFAG